MSVFAHPLRWLTGLVFGWVVAVSAAQGAGLPPASPGGVAVVGRWVPLAGLDDWAAARAAMASGAQTAAVASDDLPAFQIPAEQPVWYALDLPSSAGASPRVLELTHPSLRSAELILPARDGPPVVLRGGRDVPMAQRSGARFPATFALPPDTPPTVYLRLKSTVPAHGLFVLQARDDWATQSRWQFGAMTLCFAAVAAVVAYAVVRAWRLRSRAYGLYALLGLCIGMAGMVISGYGESWIWPALAEWRGPLASGLACLSAGLALLLAECAFALEVRAPRFSRLLRIMGVLCPLAGVLGLAFSLSVYQSLSHVAATVATVLSLSSFWFAWHTENRAAGWLLAGFVPVSLGVSITTLAVSGLIAFAPWVLMAMPLGSLLEAPFNLYGLRLLERRRALVRARRAEVERVSGPAGGCPPALLRRLASGADGSAGAPADGLLMLLRFAALAPGSPRLRALDAVSVEHFLHAMMVAAVRPGNHVGRPAFHEIVLRNPGPVSDAAISGLLTALFAQALRGDHHGLEARDTVLRIAYLRLPRAGASLAAALQRLEAALDAPSTAASRRIEVDAGDLAALVSPA